MILVVNLCKEKIHEHEFVKPICGILKEQGVDYCVREYFRLKKSDLDAEKIILCGASLLDFAYLKNIRMFEWLKSSKGDVLGICAGAQILAHLFGGELVKEPEIGKTLVRLRKDLFSLPEEFFVYSLHNLGIIPPRDFEVVAESAGGVQIMKKEEIAEGKARQILGVLFHPEVLNQEIVKGFAVS